MKKLLIIVFASFYLMLASGLNVSLHFCGNKLKTVSLHGNINEKGCCGNKKKSKKCCHERSQFIKVKDDQFASKTVKVAAPLTSIVKPFFNQLFEVSKTDKDYISLKNHSPPILYDNPIYLKQKVLII